MKKYSVLIIVVTLCFNFCGFGSSLKYITSDSIITPELSIGAVLRNDFIGFREDFLVLHCLIKKEKPKTIFEIGTCDGDSTLIMGVANPTSFIISLELEPNTAPYFLSPERIGHKCRNHITYRQVYGDSMTYDYAQHFPLEAWFIDGAHDYIHVNYETKQAIKSGARLIIYHDTDIQEVFQGLLDAFEGAEYTVYRVQDTRISYAVKNS